MTNIVIQAKNLSKTYKLYNAPIDRLKEALHPFKKNYHKNFYAINNINFEIKRGECVGILGKNGAGKSTLLKIITGVLTPSNGTLLVKGKISALLELGAGFNPEYTGIENIYFQGNIMGFSHKEVASMVDEILNFADIGEFIYQPVKTYSSGMFARLAFAVAINIEPDILIVDEALSVGDMFFQAKSMAKMKKLIHDKNTTVLFVSHDISTIKAMCDKAILLENGKIKAYDDANKVAEDYFATRFETNMSLPTFSENNLVDGYNNLDFIKTSSFQRIQNGKAEFTNVVILDENEQHIKVVKFNQNIIIRCFVKLNQDIHNLSFGFHIRNRNGIEILYDDTILQNQNLTLIKAGEHYIIDWNLKIMLQAGQYNIASVCSIPINLSVGEVDMCDFIPISAQFTVESPTANIYAALFANSTLKIKKLL